MLQGPSNILLGKRWRLLTERFLGHIVSVNPGKRTFGTDHFTCLGLLVGDGDFRPDPNFFPALSHARSFNLFSKSRSLLGALRYYSRFIPDFSRKGDLLFALSSKQTFYWTVACDDVVWNLLNCLHTKAVLRAFYSKRLTIIIMDASPTGIGAMLKQNVHLVLWESRQLSHAKHGNSETHHGALSVSRLLTRLRQYHFALYFTLVPDHEALNFIYGPYASLAKLPAAMFRRRNNTINDYSYNVQHWKSVSILCADYLSLYAASGEITTQPLPVDRLDLMRGASIWYHAIQSFVHWGLMAQVRDRFSKFLKK